MTHEKLKTYRKRRLKCDEGKPHCKRCVSSGRQCDGVFYFGAAAGSEQPITRSPLHAIPTMPFEEFKALQDMHTLFYILPKLPMVPSTDLRLSMRVTTATYMAFLPSRAGKHSALDAATHCLAAAVRWCYANDLKGQGECDSQFGQSETEMLQHHSRALGKLRRALNDPKESLSAETLCATALLCCFEVCRFQLQYQFDNSQLKNLQYSLFPLVEAHILLPSTCWVLNKS